MAGAELTDAEETFAPRPDRLRLLLLFLACAKSSESDESCWLEAEIEDEAALRGVKLSRGLVIGEDFSFQGCMSGVVGNLLKSAKFPKSLLPVLLEVCDLGEVKFRLALPGVFLLVVVDSGHSVNSLCRVLPWKLNPWLEEVLLALASLFDATSALVDQALGSSSISVLRPCASSGDDKGTSNP